MIEQAKAVAQRLRWVHTDIALMKDFTDAADTIDALVAEVERLSKDAEKAWAEADMYKKGFAHQYHRVTYITDEIVAQFNQARKVYGEVDTHVQGAFDYLQDSIHIAINKSDVLITSTFTALQLEATALPVWRADPENQPSQWGTVTLRAYQALEVQIREMRMAFKELRKAIEGNYYSGSPPKRSLQSHTLRIINNALGDGHD